VAFRGENGSRSRRREPASLGCQHRPGRRLDFFAMRPARRKRLRRALKKVRPLPYDYAARMAYLICRDRGICRLCGNPVDSRLRWPDPASPTLDHIQPVAKGGAKHDPSNQQLAHLRCNQLKGTQTMRQIEARRPPPIALRGQTRRPASRYGLAGQPPSLSKLLRGS